MSTYTKPSGNLIRISWEYDNGKKIVKEIAPKDDLAAIVIVTKENQTVSGMAWIEEDSRPESCISLAALTGKLRYLLKESRSILLSRLLTEKIKKNENTEINK
jgi:hypothetical protein